MIRLGSSDCVCTEDQSTFIFFSLTMEACVRQVVSAMWVEVRKVLVKSQQLSLVNDNISMRLLPRMQKGDFFFIYLFTFFLDLGFMACQGIFSHFVLNQS